MKYAMCNEMYEGWPFEKVCDFLAQTGYQGVEIAPFSFANNVLSIGKTERTKICAVAQNAGVEIIGLHWLLAKTEGFHLTSSDVEVRQRTFQYFEELVRLCADLGGKTIVFGSPKQRDILPGVSLETAKKNAIDFFQRLAPLLEKTGVVVALEPLAPVETNFLNNAEETVELIKKISAPKQVALHLDCKAMVGGEKLSIPEVIHQYKNEFVSFHANDPNLQGPGFGELDFAPIMKALHEINYTGWISVEAFDYSPGVERLTTESLQYMQSMMEKAKEST